MSFTKRTLIPLAALAAASAALATVTVLGATSAQAAACSSGYVGLTFDDGPQGGTTTNLLNALKANNLKATLFNEGQYASAHPDSVRAEAAAGMWIGNHSWDHPHLTQQSQSTIDSQLSRTQSAISSAGGGTPKLFRPPYGETNSTLKSVESKYGLKEIIWDVDSQDWNNASVSAIVQAAGRLQNGQIILMHEWPANTVQAIPQIAQNLSSRGLCAGMIDPSSGRAVAPTGTTTPPVTTPPVTTPPVTTPPVTTPPVTTPPVTTPPVSGGCSAAYSVTSSWSGGFVASVTVTAGSAISSWRVTLTLPSGTSIASLWSGTASGTSGTVQVSNANYNGTLGAGASTVFGFQGNGSGSGVTATCSA